MQEVLIFPKLFSKTECQNWIKEAESLGFVLIPKERGTAYRALLTGYSDYIFSKLSIPETSCIGHIIRCYRYGPGEEFFWHRDPILEGSKYSVLIYLSTCRGGETEFREGLIVQPEVGKAIVFPHHLEHRGAAVIEGVKYVLRGDLYPEKN